MTLVAAAVCPHPPMIVPEIAGGAAAELDGLRTACDAAVARLAASTARTLLVLGSGAGTAEYAHPFRGSFAPWGVPLEVTVGRPAGAWGPERLPLSLLVGAWLLRRPAQPPAATGRPDPVRPDPVRPDPVRPDPARPDPVGPETVGPETVGPETVGPETVGPETVGPEVVRMVTVDRQAPPSDCAALGGRLGGAAPWALLVMGDGSACRGPKAPGYDDPRAVPYDNAVARALADADAQALAELDPDLSARLRVAGRAPWQVLAGAVRAAGGAWRGELAYHAAPYGVAYLVASWAPA